MNAAQPTARTRRSRWLASLTTPEPNRVYQRSAADAASMSVAGTLGAEIAGVIEARLLQAGRVVLDWRPLSPPAGTPSARKPEHPGEIEQTLVPDVAAGYFAGTLPNVPIGGPYTFELRLRDGDSTRPGPRVPGLLVGDLWVLAGQSNMEGCGGLADLEPPSPHVHAFYLGDTWAVARDPLCWFNEASEPAYWREPDPAKRPAAARQERALREVGGGLAMRFGKDLHRASGVPVGLVVCPLGGSSMAQWSPRLKDQGTSCLYGAMLRRIGRAGGRVAGCLWWQGESDALDVQGRGYLENTRELFASLRVDLGQPDLPFLYVQLAPFHSWDPNVTPAGWNKVRNDQLLLERELPHLAFTAALDATLSDPIHVDSTSLRRIGARLARLALRFVNGPGAGDRAFTGKRAGAAVAPEIGPRPAGFAFEDAARTELRVAYQSVNGKLLPARDIRGFSIEKDGVPQVIASCVRGPDGRSVLITLADPAPPGANFWYARGFFPVCNLTDEAGFPAPAFGPVSLA